MNTTEMNKAIEKVFDELKNMDEDELKKEIEEHKSGDIANIIVESGMLEVTNLERSCKS